MYRRSQKERQLSLQASVYQHLTGKSSDIINDPDNWHKIFYREVVSRIDEDLFSVLFSSTNGAPNASIRVLIGMMVLKEGEGYSDEKLFENVRFNMLTRAALGLDNLNDPVPSESTYYLFRKKIAEYYQETGNELFEECFKQITKEQILEFKVSGQTIRMDSKLIGSRIANYSRYELIVRTLTQYFKHTPQSHFELLSKLDYKQLQAYAGEDPENTVYRNTNDQINDKLRDLGLLIYRTLEAVPATENSHYQNLVRIFKEQYQLDNHQQVKVTPNKEISAQSMQSPYDTECSYRNKNGQHIKGYNHNLTETAGDDNQVNLITDVATEKASYPDSGFIRKSTADSQQLLQDDIERVHADGAYNSWATHSFMNFHGIAVYLTGFQGPQGRYSLEKQGDQVVATDTLKNKELDVSLTKSGKYRIKNNKTYRYFDDAYIMRCHIRKTIEQLPEHLRKRRNNVEATIYQLAYPLRKDKTRYRGYFKNKIWALLRSLWINCARLTKYIGEIGGSGMQNVKDILQITLFMFTYIQFNIMKQS
jgi:hypothetical protein